ncbi:hypothetical protein V6N13_073101 [Hibiscus sabdariffa]
MARGIYTSSAGALELEYNIDYNLRSLNKNNFIRTELLSAETCTPSRLLSAWALNPALVVFLAFSQYDLYVLGCSGDYSDPIASPVEFPFLPRPRISADVRFSADVFSTHF